jgi:hypothetical protein
VTYLVPISVQNSSLGLLHVVLTASFQVTVGGPGLYTRMRSGLIFSFLLRHDRTVPFSVGI